MESVYKNFYKNFYLHTGGYIPTAPLNQNIFPGDFFQIRNGEMIILGNIFRNGIVDKTDTKMEYGIKLNPVNWNFSDGISKPYSGRGSGHGPNGDTFEFSKQVLAFARAGSFIFSANDPETIKIINWADIQQQLIIKMTQTYYSFRELYIVTEVASAADWTLAVAGAEKAELEIATDGENFGLTDIFGHHSTKTIQSKDIEYYHRESKRRPAFLRAKKLVVQEEKQEAFISGLMSQRINAAEWAGDFFDHAFPYESQYAPHISANARLSALDMLLANELNPNTALLYFRWANANMDDIEKLFQVV